MRAPAHHPRKHEEFAEGVGSGQLKISLAARWGFIRNLFRRVIERLFHDTFPSAQAFMPGDRGPHKIVVSAPFTGP